ncbi:MAG: hypothetical protein KC635_19150 [Myxococcales bacterium]|nr:hypothetical protein [Myxococcales bacterium]MCB9731552.1 hypothetical protein [Deltaproteobacteria bacterium]
MAILSPKKQLEKAHGTRGDLIAAILPLVGGGDDTKKKLGGATNKKLLRIYAVGREVKDKFGGKSGLIDAIAKLQFGGKAPNEGWRDKMEGFTVKRLLDHHRQVKSAANRASA